MSVKAEPIEKFDEYQYIEMMEILQETIENDLEISVSVKAGRYLAGQMIIGRVRVHGEQLFVDGQKLAVERILEIRRAK